ncbi:MAG: phospholipase D-like domain-containing protein [Anaerolineae bacterium]|nr:phospholipase D-like domain-containing protein [Anaerolineae bacterium]
MPRIFDNLTDKLQDALIQTLPAAHRADFCVGYFNLRGWRLLANSVEHMTGGKDNCVRLLVGMTTTPRDDVHRMFSLQGSDIPMDGQIAIRLRNQIVEEFRQQLIIGVPTDADERGLRQLVRQLRAKKLIVKLYLRAPLHAKLYLTHRNDYNNPRTAFLGSSNLTLSGLSLNGELNTDLTDQDSTQKLADWFTARWEDRFSLDITDPLADVIEQSWAGENGLTPYEVYLKMAYHLSEEAREGILTTGALPKPFDTLLFDYQTVAVQMAVTKLHKRNVVLLGDVVGLGKTLVSAAVAKVYQEDYGTNLLVLCPPNLVKMWKDVLQEYHLIGDVMPTSLVDSTKGGLATLRRYRLVILDESHNFRNAEGKRYAAIRDYIAGNVDKLILLSATPYNKNYEDLAGQLGLFLDNETDLGVRPEAYLREIGGESAFISRSRDESGVRTLAAFRRSNHPDDWRDLMRLYMVRRTRSFILKQKGYVHTDEDGRKYLQKSTGERAYFPTRTPKTVTYEADAQYRRLYDDIVVNAINQLSLPRHGLVQYLVDGAERAATDAQKRLIDNLSRAGQRLIGFTRTGLFKRLESSGHAFMLSLDRHVLRNYLFLYALDNDLDLPLGTLTLDDTSAEGDTSDLDPDLLDTTETSTSRYEQRAEAAYAQLAAKPKRYDWLPARLFTPALRANLVADCALIERVQHYCGAWDSGSDTKLAALFDLLHRKHPNQKVLVFSQFADTITYLERELSQRGVTQMAAATGQTNDVVDLARRFSPRSNHTSHQTYTPPADELRVLLSTDVLSEGQNLQDAAIVVNFDLPWAIIRLSQRAGRVDRIGQQSSEIMCYSFLPADGVERLIRLRARVRQRLNENGEVIGSDEKFFEDDVADLYLTDLYTEAAGVYDDKDIDDEVDLASEAYQIWANATADNNALRERIEKLPNVVYATRAAAPEQSDGVITYIKTHTGGNALVWMGADGTPITQSQKRILDNAACAPDTPATPRRPDHHERVRDALALVHDETRNQNHAGNLGHPKGARARAYNRMKRYHETLKGTLFEDPVIGDIVHALYTYPLTASARESLLRQMKTEVRDEDLAQLLIYLHNDRRLSVMETPDDPTGDPQVVCSLGLSVL